MQIRVSQLLQLHNLASDALSDTLCIVDWIPSLYRDRMTTDISMAVDTKLNELRRYMKLSLHSNSGTEAPPLEIVLRLLSRVILHDLQYQPTRSLDRDIKEKIDEDFRAERHILWEDSWCDQVRAKWFNSQEGFLLLPNCCLYEVYTEEIFSKYRQAYVDFKAIQEKEEASRRSTQGDQSESEAGSGFGYSRSTQCASSLYRQRMVVGPEMLNGDAGNDSDSQEESNIDLDEY